MSLIVQKYGGSVLSNFEDIEKVGKNIMNTYKKGNQVIAVVSALKNETDDLIGYAKKISKNPDARELDMLISTGEQKTGALISLFLQANQLPAQSFTGHQIGIITDLNYGNAGILKINTDKLRKDLEFGKVIIVAGFQGVNQLEDITTLGRGGSDLTAVALAASLKADLLEFYKDTGSIFTSNPMLSPGKKIKKIDYLTLLELTKGDVRIVSEKAVELAEKYNVPMMIRSLNGDNKTIIINEDFSYPEEKYLAISVKNDEYQITVKKGEDFDIFKLLDKKNNINYLDKINTGDGVKYLLTVNRSELSSITKNFRSKKADFNIDGPFARIVVIGWGYRTQKNFYNKMIELLNTNAVRFKDIHFSGFNVSLLLDKAQLKEFSDIINGVNCD